MGLEVEGLEEGGAYFWASYPSLEGAVRALEVFLSKPLDEWTPPHLDPVERSAASPDHGALADAIRSRAISFPPGAEYQLQDSYWSQFLPGRRRT